MGGLSDFNLDGLISDFGCRVLVDTGHDGGNTLQFAANCRFEQIFSIESSHKKALDIAFRHSSDHRITVVHAKIGRGLRETLDDLPADLPALFWLNVAPPQPDAEPGRLPLETYLRLLASRRNLRHDIIFANDARLYMDAAFEAGPADPASLPPPELRSLDFADEILAATHDVTVLTQGTGLLCAFPKSRQG